MKHSLLSILILTLLFNQISNAQELQKYNYADGKISFGLPTEPKAQTAGDRIVLTSVDKQTVYQIIYFTKDYDVSNSEDWFKDALGKYGKLLKYVQTDSIGVVKDAEWPHPVIGESTGGWAAIERPDGTIELAPISLFKKKGSSIWQFTAISNMPVTYDMIGAEDYHSGRGEFGYLMKKENVAKCYKWE